MPEQSLWQRRPRLERVETSPGAVGLRRFFVFAAATAMTLVGANEMYLVLDVGGLTIPESLVLVLYVSLFAWIALSFVGALIGFFLSFAADRTLGIDTSAPLPALSTRTAILMPTYNEEPRRVMARVEAIYRSIEQAGYGVSFDFTILSDTTDPAIWIEEELQFLRLRERTSADCFFYRHRAKNIARKAGNIADWVVRFGGRYQQMIVLDADSLMSADTIVRITAAMESHPNVGLIQTVPVLLNGNTVFARIQQFAGRTYGPLIARGIAWWHGGDSNYWGHNAVIRVKAFAEQAGLPLLRGRKPFGGHILSHDFVEAALMRRGGWAIHMVPTLGGSFEECPPTLTDYLLRDRRWCQGNLQHVGVLPARGLHWLSRLHLLMGIGSYITAPLWLVFLLGGLLIALQAQFVRPEYFPAGATLFPQWPAQDPVRAAWVFALTMGLLIVPKLLGYIIMLTTRQGRRAMSGAVRGFFSVFLETLISALMAPVMMLMQSKSVLEILLGRDAGWNPQRRDDGTVPVGEIVKAYAGVTLVGVLFAVSAYAISWSLLLWMSPVVVGLLLAIPLALLTSHPSCGSGLRRWGLLTTQEERDPPDMLLQVNRTIGEPTNTAQSPIEMLRTNPALQRFHLAGLPEKRARGDFNVDRLVAIAKLQEAENAERAMGSMSTKELMALLQDREALTSYVLS